MARKLWPVVYTSIPRPLFQEVIIKKQYIEDLLNKQWARKSRSNYSSSVVAVRKRDGDLRLCVESRKWNQKSLPDKHPIPGVQYSVEGLGGNGQFSLLNQRKAYCNGRGPFS